MQFKQEERFRLNVDNSRILYKLFFQSILLVLLEVDIVEAKLGLFSHIHEVLCLSFQILFSLLWKQIPFHLMWFFRSLYWWVLSYLGCVKHLKSLCDFHQIDWIVLNELHIGVLRVCFWHLMFQNGLRNDLSHLKFIQNQVDRKA